MNNQKQRRLREVADYLTIAKYTVVDVYTEEQDMMNRMSEVQQESDLFDEMEEAVSVLIDVEDSITTALDGINELI